jgi:hypothetical protein
MSAFISRLPSEIRGCDCARRAILLSSLNIECSFAELPDTKTELQLRDCGLVHQLK